MYALRAKHSATKPFLVVSKLLSFSLSLSSSSIFVFVFVVSILPCSAVYYNPLHPNISQLRKVFMRGRAREGSICTRMCIPTYTRVYGCALVINTRTHLQYVGWGIIILADGKRAMSRIMFGCESFLHTYVRVRTRICT